MGELKLVRNIFYNKYDYARYIDSDFDRDAYEWHLGCEVVDYLRMVSDEYCMYIILDNHMYIFGIPVIPDYKDKWRISLLKEIKR